MENKKIIEKLRQDKHYYGKFGQQFLSNSDIKVLANEPKRFRAKVETNNALEEGRYFHQLILEPHKAKDFPMVEASTRNSKDYKDYLEKNKLDFCLKKSEADLIKECADWFMNEDNNATKSLRELIFSFEALHEEPTIAELHGHKFKAKADVICKDIIIDLKTTSKNVANINRYTFDEYGYSSQAYVYQKLFGMPICFVFIGKTKKYYGTKPQEFYYDVAIINPSESTLQNGEQKVQEALLIYDKYYGENADSNIEEAVIKKEV
tara:strand:- start:788 stop:1579 length:792 start_codon:yes stop_codon:yes gene_type:complete